MRRRRSRRAPRAAALALLALAGTLPRTARGQIDQSGAAFLLLPISARSVGVGGAHVADGVGTDAVVSNPAALAWLERREGALHYGQDLVTNRVLASLAWPERVLGTFALSASLTDQGESAATSSAGVQTGTVAFRSLFIAGSYGSSLGERVAVGVTYKFVQNRFDCTGDCNPDNDPLRELPPNASTSAVDVGVQYRVGPKIPLVLGVAVRHLGARLQVEDEQQADELPTEASLGARYEIPNVARLVPDAQVRVLGEVVRGIGGNNAREVRIGAEGTYRGAFVLRAGIRMAGANDESDGPGFGFGYAGRRFAFDFARQIGGLSAESDKPPTFVSLRVWF